MGPGAAAAYLVGRVPGVLEVVTEVGGADRLLRVGERVPRLGELRVEVLHLRVRRGATQSAARLRRQQCAEGRSQGGRDGAGRDRAGRDRAGHEVTSGRQHLSSAALHASSHRSTARDGASNTARRNFRSRAGQSDLGLQQVGDRQPPLANFRRRTVMDSSLQPEPEPSAASADPAPVLSAMETPAVPEQPGVRHRLSAGHSAFRGRGQLSLFGFVAGRETHSGAR